MRQTIVRNRPILAATAKGCARGALRRRAEFRHHVMREAWTVAKRFAADSVENIEFREIPCLGDAVVEGYLEDQQRLVLAALVRGLGCRTCFEIGTNRGRTAWTIAHNNPSLELYTLDVPPATLRDQTAFELGDDDRFCFRDESCGEALRGTPEAERITQLWGDSATLDFTPFEGKMDFVYVDGAHTYDYVKSDSANALRLLSPTGTIAWDDYTTGTGVYEHILEIAASSDRPIYHVFGTRWRSTAARTSCGAFRRMTSRQCPRYSSPATSLELPVSPAVPAAALAAPPRCDCAPRACDRQRSCAP